MAKPQTRAELLADVRATLEHLEQQLARLAAKEYRRAPRHWGRFVMGMNSVLYNATTSPRPAPAFTAVEGERALVETMGCLLDSAVELVKRDLSDPDARERLAGVVRAMAACRGQLRTDAARRVAVARAADSAERAERRRLSPIEKMLDRGVKADLAKWCGGRQGPQCSR